MTEAQFTARVTAIWRKQGAIVIPIIAGAPGSLIGVPDRFVAHWKWSGFVEFKNTKTILEKHQRLFMENLRKRNVNAVVYRYPNIVGNRIIEPEEFLERMNMISSVAMSIFQKTVSAKVRIDQLHNQTHFDYGNLTILVNSKHWATEMPYTIAKQYLKNALDCCLNKAQNHCAPLVRLGPGGDFVKDYR